MIKTLAAAFVTASIALTLSCGAGEAAYVTGSSTYSARGISHSRTVHTRNGARTVRVIHGRGGHTCRVVGQIHRTAYGSRRSIRKICR